MTLSIVLPPEMEKRLIDEAERHGVDASAYASQLLKDRLEAAGPHTPIANDIDQALDDFFEANPESLPPSPPDLSRADFYSDHN
ncbi:MAG TPA: hypothetical protein VIM11_05285 [Tepidisphaeraceae bacterium]|jgi:hypothetical protein